MKGNCVFLKGSSVGNGAVKDYNDVSDEYILFTLKNKAEVKCDKLPDTLLYEYGGKIGKWLETNGPQ